MTVFVCVDTRGGMTFNKRRQSRDIRVIEDILRVSKDGTLYISEFSRELFEGKRAKIVCDTAPLETAPNDAFVFIENEQIGKYTEKIDKLIVYNWGEPYPFDMKLDINPKECGFRLRSRREFVGNSHDKVTREDFTK